MKNIFLPKVMMCIIALFTLILPASAQNTNATDEYKETLKKIMVLSGASATTDDFFQKITSVMKRMRLIGMSFLKTGKRK